MAQEQDGIVRPWNMFRKEERANKKSRREDSGKKEDIGDFSSID
jgi:hypothetical protein